MLAATALEFTADRLPDISPEPLNVVLISDEIRQADAVRAAATSDVTPVVYDSDTMTTGQLADTLQHLLDSTGKSRIGQLSLVAHGSPGRFLLGDDAPWTVDTLSREGDSWEELRRLLGEDAEILVYGCAIAATPDGAGFLDQLAGVTGATVFASSNAVGNGRGADWTWEYTSGSETWPASPFAIERLQKIDGLRLEDLYEPNDSKVEVDGQPEAGVNSSNLGLLTSTRVISNLALEDSADWYRFRIGGVGTTDNFVQVNFDRAQGDVDLYVYRSNGTTILDSSTRFSSNSNGGQETVSLAGAVSGTYYAKVVAKSASSPFLANYQLVIAAPAATGDDAYEENDSKTEVDGRPEGGTNSPNLGLLTSTKTISNLVLNDGDDLSIADWYRFRIGGVGTTSHQVQLDFDRTQGDVDLYVYRSNGTTILDSSTRFSSNSNGGQEIVSLAGAISGTYYVKVVSKYIDSSYKPQGLANYQLVIAAPAATGDDAYEENDSKTEVDGRPEGGTNSPNLGLLTSTKTISNLVLNDGDDLSIADWYRFRIGEGATTSHEVQINFDRAQGDVDLYVYKQDGTSLWGSSTRFSSNSNGGQEIVSLGGAVPGVYYAKIVSKYANSSHKPQGLANYQFVAVVPTTSLPEIAVTGLGQNIADGDGTPDSGDGTDFGATFVGGAPVNRTFTIHNIGTLDLAVGTVSVPAGFSVVTQPTATVAPGSTTTFVVRLESTTVGTKQGTLSFGNNDSDESPFDFTIRGVVSAESGPIQVTNTADSGPGSLRQAILDANAFSGLDTIEFDLPGSGIHTISPLSGLPSLTDAVVIDATSQPGYSGKPLIQLDGSLAGDVNGLRITAGNSRVSGLAIGNYTYGGIVLAVAGGNTITGNYIGTSASGETAMANGYGLVIELGSSGNQIGTDGDGVADSAERNVISGNQWDGIYVGGDGTRNNVIAGNLIGLSASGINALPNSYGIRINDGASDNRVGTNGDGVADGEERNIISGNTASGVLINGAGTDGNAVAGNWVGPNLEGTGAIANEFVGIMIHGGASHNSVGGMNSALRNVVSGNLVAGISVESAAATGNLILGNWIGVAPDGASPMGNQPGSQAGWGVIVVDASANTIGGSESGKGNVIAHNAGPGVSVFGETAIANRVSGNSIFANGFLGIDVGNDGVTLNDADDSDAGPNLRQNFPVIESAESDGTTTTVTGVLSSQPGQTFRLEFFASAVADSTGFGEGSTYLGFVTATTNSAGSASWEFVPGATIPVGHRVTATATDSNGNTSEFSFAAMVEAVPTFPEIAVAGLTQNIVDGDTSPTVADGTDFGSLTQGDLPFSRTFVIHNSGDADLTVGNAVVPAGFTVVTQPSSPVAPGASTTIVVRLDSSSVGVKQGALTFSNNDSDESPFDFVIRGEIVEAGTLDATFVGTDLVITDIDVQGNNNDLSISVVGTDLIISDVNIAFASVPVGGVLSDGNKTLTLPASSVSGGLIINAGHGDDTVTLGSLGSFVPGGVTINGGEGDDSYISDSSTQIAGDLNINLGNGANDAAILGLFGGSAVKYNGGQGSDDVTYGLQGTPINPNIKLSSGNDRFTLAGTATIDSSIRVDFGGGDDSFVNSYGAFDFDAKLLNWHQFDRHYDLATDSLNLTQLESTGDVRLDDNGSGNAMRLIAGALTTMTSASNVRLVMLDNAAGDVTVDFDSALTGDLILQLRNGARMVRFSGSDNTIGGLLRIEAADGIQEIVLAANADLSVGRSLVINGRDGNDKVTNGTHNVSVGDAVILRGINDFDSANGFSVGGDFLLVGVLENEPTRLRNTGAFHVAGDFTYLGGGGVDEVKLNTGSAFIGGLTYINLGASSDPLSRQIVRLTGNVSLHLLMVTSGDSHGGNYFLTDETTSVAGDVIVSFANTTTANTAVFRGSYGGTYGTYRGGSADDSVTLGAVAPGMLFASLLFRGDDIFVVESSTVLDYLYVDFGLDTDLLVNQQGNGFAFPTNFVNLP